ncbi:hypothetical protein ACFSTA_10410 [Ornithinibacillus salinisoli]|uniref:Uncharacterized protein n=1 Tax=Ornithinibacillus salinisoli TaxID=1848459 RepID=A0ABW4VYN5_9BACI
MKKVGPFLFMCLIIFSIVACSSEENNFRKQYPDLLPSNHNNYSILAVEEKITSDLLKKHNIKRVSPIMYYSSIEHIKNELPELQLEESPVFVLFDENGVVSKFHSIEDLIEFLKANN